MAIDPRGPFRFVVETEWKCDGTYVLMDCGHIGINAPHFATPKIGSERRCFKCGKIEQTLNSTPHHHFRSSMY